MMPRRLLFFFLALTLPVAVCSLAVCAEDGPVKDEDARLASKPSKKKAAKTQAFDYEKSRYKSREISQTPTYKFNAKGEPITAQTKKKASTKKKRRSEPPEIGSQEGAEGCGSGAGCAEKHTEADAL
ncbi:MAG: hypothetical protein AAB268_09105 [Elusimicrobiota bacterium]